MTRIGLEGMEFYSFHGYYAAERKMGNKYVLDVFVELKTELVDSEEIQDTVNYEHIYEICKMEMKEPKQLLETVAYSIADTLKKRFTIIKKVSVRLQKIGVQLGGKVKKSVIEYEI
jgi:dihydroneopterin aldolase